MWEDTPLQTSWKVPFYFSCRSVWLLSVCLFYVSVFLTCTSYTYWPCLDATIEGHLKKKSKRGVWQQRWFSIRESRFNYYANQHSTHKMLFTLDLSDVALVRLTNEKKNEITLVRLDMIHRQTLFVHLTHTLTLLVCVDHDRRVDLFPPSRKRNFGKAMDGCTAGAL
jgi:hypothetical protein